MRPDDFGNCLAAIAVEEGGCRIGKLELLHRLIISSIYFSALLLDRFDVLRRLASY